MDLIPLITTEEMELGNQLYGQQPGNELAYQATIEALKRSKNYHIEDVELRLQLHEELFDYAKKSIIFFGKASTLESMVTFLCSIVAANFTVKYRLKYIPDIQDIFSKWRQIGYGLEFAPRSMNYACNA